jgi:hypothetical protein
MSESQVPAEIVSNEATAEVPTQPLPNPWTARIGLVVVAGILVSCFGLLIAASHAGTSAL